MNILLLDINVIILMIIDSYFINGYWWLFHCKPFVATPLWGLGVLRDSRMFRVRQQRPKHLALRCSWCHWKGLEV